MSQENDQIIEDVEEKNLVESEVEVSEETEVAEQQGLSNTVLDILLGEAKKKNEEEEDEEMDDSEEEEEMEESADEDEDDSEEMEESADEDEEDSEEMEESADEDEDDSEEEEEMEESADEDEEMDDSEEEEEMEESADEDEDEDEEDSEEIELPEVKTKAGILAASFNALKGMKKSSLVSAYEAINMSEEEGEVEVPSTKADIINAMYGQLKSMKKDDLQASYKSIMASCGGMHEETETDSFADDLKVLADAEQGLTEDFKSKASVLFEAAVANKVNEIQESLEEQYAEDLTEEVTYIRESLVEKIDNYLSYVVESFIEDNQEFVDNKLRTEITENFMSALQGVFTEHYIEVPESKIDLVDQLSDEVTEIKESLAEVESQRSELAQQVETLQREKIIAEASSDLASTQASKLASLVESTAFVNAETFAEKVNTIKEGFFKESASKLISEDVDGSTSGIKTIVEGAAQPNANIPKDMARYVQHLSRFK
jgi:hypothetical protein